MYVPDRPDRGKTGSSPPERPGLDNITAQQCSGASCPCTVSSNALLPIVTLFPFQRQTVYHTVESLIGANFIQKKHPKDVRLFLIFCYNLLKFSSPQYPPPKNEKLHCNHHKLFACWVVGIVIVLNVQQSRLYLHCWFK